MRSQLLLCILGAFVSTCVAEEATCDAGGCVDDDRSHLLQVDVVKHEGEGNAHDAKSIHHTHGESEGWPGDIFKKIKNAVGGVDALEKDFDAVKTAVATFEKEVHSEVQALVDNFPSTIDASPVEATYIQIYASAEKLVKVLEKVTATFLSGIGKVCPDKFKSAMTKTLHSVNKQAKHFADSFKTAANELKKTKVNTKEVCKKVKHGLEHMLKEASALASSTLGLSTKGLNKEILEAKELLPEPLKKEVDKMLHKANSAADHLLSSLTPAMKEIAHGVAHAFKGQCTELPHAGAGRAEVGLLSLLMISVLAFFM